MRVLILGINYRPETIGIAVYTGDLAESLVEAGHEVDVVTAPPYYPDWRIASEHRGIRWRSRRENGVAVLRCPIYVPKKPTGFRRILHHLSFAASALAPMLVRAFRRRGRRPDLVLVIAPALLAAPVGWFSARVAGARAWLHIQDFEVEAAFATELLQDGGMAARLARWFERRILGLFDMVSTISPEMVRKLHAMNIAPGRIHELRNWADIDRISPLERASEYRGRFGIETTHVALYSGNIANKQGIEIILRAAQILGHRNDLTFVICGNGPSRVALERAATGLPHIRFHDLQSVEELSELLGLASVHLLPQKGSASDLVLPSKLTNMLASGRPVIATAHEGSGLAREVVGCGLSTAPGDAEGFASAIARLLDDDDLRERLGRAARHRAETIWRRDAIITDFIERAQSCLSGSSNNKDRLR